MIDSEATDNYILQQAIRMLGLTLQWALKPMQVYMVNREFKWITDQVHIKAIILEDSQELTFDVLNLIKYDVILEMPWLRKKNSRIDWISKELYVMIDVYKILEQPEMSLSEHKSWDHEIPLLNDKQSKWMSLYSMSENQLKKVKTYLNENLKRGFIPWWFCNHIPWWNFDILRWPWDALQSCAQGTEKAQWKNFVCEEVKKQIWSKGNQIP